MQPTVDELEWWRRNKVFLPAWSQAAQKAFLLQQSSATVECVFSFICQANSLEDYLEASIMLQYNSRCHIRSPPHLVTPGD